MSPEKLAYSEVACGSQHTEAGGHGELRSYQLTRCPECGASWGAPLLRFHLLFPPQKRHPCQVSFIFHHCGSFLMDVSLNKKHGHHGKPVLQGGRALPGSGEPLLRDPPHRLTHPQRGKSQPPAQAKDGVGVAGGAWVPFPTAGHGPESKHICGFKCSFCIGG